MESDLSSCIGKAKVITLLWNSDTRDLGCSSVCPLEGDVELKMFFLKRLFLTDIYHHKKPHCAVRK